MQCATARLVPFLFIAVAAPAGAQESTPRQDYELITGQPKRAPVIPPEFRVMVVESTPDRLVVRGVSGQPIPVSLDWIEPETFTTYQDGRYLAFPFNGYESFGYLMVDRRGQGAGAVIDLGHAPSFSPDGRFFAAAQMSDAGWGNLEGVALWEVRPDRTIRRLFSDAVPYGHDWRVDGWGRPDCVAISAVVTGWEAPEGQDPEQAARTAPRNHYEIVFDESQVALRATHSRAGCTPEGSPG